MAILGGTLGGAVAVPAVLAAATTPTTPPAARPPDRTGPGGTGRVPGGSPAPTAAG
ncbi:hypothetical protein O7634_29455 [Micromonospora sp. WMMD1120]|uniref:hypothetical protein n=1 Tax=Micromonospora sp. WMMD1120 TaxID=3016106 RepID=UPI0024161982|nr:hypothetical protein [Micromonospora sp. WMMD1120]MDG4810905.1 hypothetical protein [Micromonospora sp. WMMD1120]